MSDRISDLDRQIMADPRHPASDALRRAVDAEAERDRLRERVKGLAAEVDQAKADFYVTEEKRPLTISDDQIAGWNNAVVAFHRRMRAALSEEETR